MVVGLLSICSHSFQQLKLHNREHKALIKPFSVLIKHSGGEGRQISHVSLLHSNADFFQS